MNEAKVSEATKPDSGLRSVQQEMSHRDQMIGWLACLGWLVAENYILPYYSAIAQEAMEDELKRLREGGR